MILNANAIQNMLANEKLADIYLAHRIHGETFRSIAQRHNIDTSTAFDKYTRACHQVCLELQRELARTEYTRAVTRRRQDTGEPVSANVPTHVFYVNGHTNKDTFTVPNIRAFIVPHCDGLTLNAFSGFTPLTVEGSVFVNNDLNVECPANYHLDCSSPEFVGALQHIAPFDTILVDPPFSLYLARRKYHSEWFRDFTLVKNNLDKLTRVGTKVITLGFNSTGMGSRRGYEKEELLIVNCKGNNNDIMCLVERKVRQVQVVEGAQYEQTEIEDIIL